MASHWEYLDWHFHCQYLPSLFVEHGHGRVCREMEKESYAVMRFRVLTVEYLIVFGYSRELKVRSDNLERKYISQLSDDLLRPTAMQKHLILKSLQLG
jgi:hypothetical protein